jgi:hypothetical protein
MSGAGGGGGGYNAGASKKPRLADSENESEHIVSMILVVATQGGNKVCQVTCCFTTSVL